jgi:hypothetical protein
MPPDMSIAHWVDGVAKKQWQKEDAALDAIGAAVPLVIADSRPLSEVHRLDLSLFAIFEEAALRVSGALTRNAPSNEAMYFAAQQTIDEARHHEIFMNRLAQSGKAIGIDDTVVSEAIKTPPLLRFLERCDEVVDRGNFVEGLVLMNLVFEGMAYPLYAYEQRYWAPVDPYLSELVRTAFVDETRHVNFGIYMVKKYSTCNGAHQAGLTALCRDATMLMSEVFDYYVHKFVKLFDSVARIHKDLFAAAEFAPGRLISETPYKDQIKAIHESINTQHDRILTRAGLH